MQQVSWTKFARNKFLKQKSPRNKSHAQNQFHEDKNQCTRLTKRKINMQLVPRTNISMQDVKFNVKWLILM